MKHPTHTTPMTIRTAAIGIVALALCAPALAQPPDRGPITIADAETRISDRIAAMDQDGDGTVTPEEFNNSKPGPGNQPKAGRRKGRMGKAMADQLPALFDRLDDDRDGTLSQAEFTRLPDAMQETRRAKAFTRLDSDGDGRITSADQSPYIARLRAADTDGDGVVSRKERRAMMRTMMGGRHRGGAGR